MATENEVRDPIAVHGATADNLSQGQGVDGAPAAPKDTGVTKPAPTAEEKAAEAAAKAKEAEAPAAKQPDDKEEPADATDPADDKIEYLELKDPTGNAVIELLKEAGVKAVEANLIFEEAYKTGDPTKIKWDVLKSRLGDAKFVLAQQGIDAFYNNTYKKNQEATATAYEIVGGEDNWKKVTAWVKRTEAANPKMKADFDEIRTGIDAGGRLLKHAVADLKAMYEADAKNNGLGVGKVVKGSSVPGPLAGTALSRGDYLTAMKEAMDKRASPTVIANLRARRAAGRQQGL